MAYRFKPGRKDVTADVRRIAAEEFALMRRVLSDAGLPPARQVHEVRKSTKRLRSLLRLAGPSMPEAKAEAAVLRDAALALSAARDSGAVIEALGTLKLPAETLQLAEAALLRARAQAMPDEEASELLRAFGKEMRAMARRARDWTVEPGGFEALAPGLRRGYRRLQKAFAASQTAEDEEPLHEWRKKAKDHWHHTLLLRRIHPAAMSAHARTAEEVSDALGSWRDYGLLIAAIAALPARSLRKGLAHEVRDAALAAQGKMLKTAYRPTQRLTAETPRALVRRWGAYWDAG
ncbi:CHAD domain-containing protein [Hyphomonas sp.]|uniref:CHAD domain-containing protein n=1 Tax=Hyphomonas sp. TaxID=87 RepID=UPI00391C0845